MKGVFKGNKELEIYLLKKEEELLEEKYDLLDLKEEKEKELLYIDEEFAKVENEINAYKKYKKSLIKNSIVNILQIIGVVALFMVPVNYLNMKLIAIAANKLKIYNLISLIIGIFGNTIILGMLGIELNDYKKNNNKDYFNGKIESDLENNKNYIIEYINEIENKIEQNQNNLNKIHNTFLKRRIDRKFYNIFEKENEDIKKKVFKK